MANKFKLTCYGKDEPICMELRILIENKPLANTVEDSDVENSIL